MLQCAADQTWRASLPPCFIIYLSAAILESNERHLGVRACNDQPHWTTHAPEGRPVSRAGKPVLLCRQGHCAGRHGHLCIHHLPERVRFMQYPLVSSVLISAISSPGVITPGQIGQDAHARALEREALAAG